MRTRLSRSTAVVAALTAQLALSALPSTAQAFCGAYVGPPGGDIKNESSQIILARFGQESVVTVANDFQGDAGDFALVIPVPHVLDASHVGTVHPSVFAQLDGWSAPRFAQYTCEEAFREEHMLGMAPTYGPGCTMMLGCSSAADIGATDTAWSYGVTVEAQFQASEYDIVILSAEGAEGLDGWLAANGYAIPAGGEDILQSYIDSGSYFLAAKINLDTLPEGRSWLSPLQFRYTSDSFGLPLRIGTISSAGEQSMTLYTLAGSEVRVANYPELTVEADCMWRPPESDGEAIDFAGFYQDVVDSKRDELGGAAWHVEYSWGLQTKCDPCTDTGPISQQTLADLGWDDPWLPAHVTRISMNYRPEDITEDLVLYESSINAVRQMRFLVYDRQMEFLFPVCGEGMVAEPGYCGDDEESGSGCSVPGGPVGSAFILAIGIVMMRRRRD